MAESSLISSCRESAGDSNLLNVHTCPAENLYNHLLPFLVSTYGYRRSLQQSIAEFSYNASVSILTTQ